MKREENLLFGLYAWRVGLLNRDQISSVVKTMRTGTDVDLGRSLTKRGVLDVAQSDALWAFTYAQIARTGGDARRALGLVPMDEEIKQVVMGSLLAHAVPPSGGDPPTLRLPDAREAIEEAGSEEPAGDEPPEVPPE
ncbi:MAG: hypothetical protein HYY18_21395 [Planctomycetes bacterium]|nr:hypothetical protein [Planctomycetota bacterium]